MASLVVSKQLGREGSDIVSEARACQESPGTRHSSDAKARVLAGLLVGLLSRHFRRPRAVPAMIPGSAAAVSGSALIAVSGRAVRQWVGRRAGAEFIDMHRDEMKALLEIFLAGGFAYGAEEERTALSPLERIPRRGQREGAFRPFDVTVMTTMIQRAIDGLPFLLAANPSIDVGGYGAEVATVFELATKASG